MRHDSPQNKKLTFYLTRGFIWGQPPRLSVERSSTLAARVPHFSRALCARSGIFLTVPALTSFPLLTPRPTSPSTAPNSTTRAAQSTVPRLNTPIPALSLGSHQHRLPIQGHLSRPERRPNRMHYRTAILHRQLRRSRNCHQSNEHAAHRQPNHHAPRNATSLPSDRQPQRHKRNAGPGVSRAKRQSSLPPIKRCVEQKVINCNSSHH